MEAMRSTWTDERLDDLNLRVDRGFDRVDRRFEQVDARFAEIDGRLFAIQKLLVQGFVALLGTMLAGFAAMIVLIATQL